MQVTIERPIDDPSSEDRCCIFGVADFQTETSEDGDPQVRLHWPMNGALNGEETVVDATVAAAGETEAFGIDAATLHELMVDQSYAENTVAVTREPNSRINNIVKKHLYEDDKEDITIVWSGPNSSNEINFFNTTA